MGDLADKLARIKAAKAARATEAPTPDPLAAPGSPPVSAPPRVAAAPAGGVPRGLGRPSPTGRRVTCRCGAEVVWVVLPSGAVNPLDPMPVEVVSTKALRTPPPGAVREPVLYRMHRGALTSFAGYQVPLETPGPRLWGWRTHFATCPRGDEWIGRRPG